MGKTVHLLPTVPAIACYGVTLYTVYIISFGAVHGKEQNCYHFIVVAQYFREHALN